MVILKLPSSIFQKKSIITRILSQKYILLIYDPPPPPRPAAPSWTFIVWWIRLRMGPKLLLEADPESFVPGLNSALRSGSLIFFQ